MRFRIFDPISYLRNTHRQYARALALALMLLPLGHCVDAHAAVTQSAVTSYVQMTNEITEEAAQSSKITFCSIGRSSSGERDIWLVRVSGDKVDTTKTVRLMVLCRQHGDEPASTEAVLGLLKKVAAGQDSSITRELKNVTLYLIPMVNPDGAVANTRLNAAHADLNRDWGIFSQPETQAVKKAIQTIRPHVIVDAHNWDRDDPHPFDCIEVALPRHDALVEADRSLQADAIGSLGEIGYHVHPTGFGPKNDPWLAHRYYTSRGKIAMLVETHPGASTDHADFMRRQQLYVALIHMLVRTLAHDSDFKRGRLDKLEGYSGYKDASAESALFTPLPSGQTPWPVPTNTMPTTIRHVAKSLLWLVPICALVYLLMLAATSLRANTLPEIPGVFPKRGSARTEDPRSPGRSANERSNTARELGLSPFRASGGRTASRHGKRPYRGLPYETESPPPAEAYDHTSQTPNHDNQPPNPDEASSLPAISR
jgi:hypothetical protein